MQFIIIILLFLFIIYYHLTGYKWYTKQCFKLSYQMVFNERLSLSFHSCKMLQHATLKNLELCLEFIKLINVEHSLSESPLGDHCL